MNVTELERRQSETARKIDNAIRRLIDRLRLGEIDLPSQLPHLLLAVAALAAWRAGWWFDGDPAMAHPGPADSAWGWRWQMLVMLSIGGLWWMAAEGRRET